jgi:hypothetical protein
MKVTKFFAVAALSLAAIGAAHAGDGLGIPVSGSDAALCAGVNMIEAAIIRNADKSPKAQILAELADKKSKDFYAYAVKEFGGHALTKQIMQGEAEFTLKEFNAKKYKEVDAKIKNCTDFYSQIINSTK